MRRHISVSGSVYLISTFSVANNVLEIRFYWAGKRTMRIHGRGVYGPLISAVSVVSDVFGPVYKGQLPDDTVIAVSSSHLNQSKEIVNF
ncbi:hypothetical protein CMV_013900 [Castanea mollissima]|uniref:Malectin domain-containing protein n=1 Tax=Castanea mollissima TaxID=60419 RepID=A0A8J4QYN9_9ROSI|nr:hypothetical protein CMV_013900 [Castanea mollissima]